MLHFNFSWAMHLLHTPSLCGTVNLAGNSRSETRKQFSLHLWGCSYRTPHMTSPKVKLEPHYNTKIPHPVTSWPMQGAALWGMAFCHATRTVCCCGLTDKLFGSHRVRVLPPINECQRNLFESCTASCVCVTLSAEKVCLSTNRSLLAAGAPSASAGLLGGSLNHTLDLPHLFCSITVLNNFDI